MSFKRYNGDFEALTGAIFASWFITDPNEPAAYALGFAETTHRPWCLFYRCMQPAGARTYLGAAVDQEIEAADNFLEVFFNLLIEVNNYFAANGGEEPPLSQIPAIIRTNGNPAVDAALSGWLITHASGLHKVDWGCELYLRATDGARDFTSERYRAGYERHARSLLIPTPEEQFARWWALVTDRSFLEPSTLQFARTWIDATPRSYRPPGRRARKGGPMPYSAVARFFDNFQMPLLPPEIDEQSLLACRGVNEHEP